jgi:hypothetical protein
MDSLELSEIPRALDKGTFNSTLAKPSFENLDGVDEQTAMSAWV